MVNVDDIHHRLWSRTYGRKRDKGRIAARLAKRMKDLGYDVSFTATASA